MKTQNKAIAKDAALTGLPTLDKNDEPTFAQRQKWQREYAAAQDSALKMVKAIEPLLQTEQRDTAQHSPLPAITEASGSPTHKWRTSQKWAQIAGEYKGAIETIEGERDHYKTHATLLANALKIASRHIGSKLAREQTEKALAAWESK